MRCEQCGSGDVVITLGPRRVIECSRCHKALRWETLADPTRVDEGERVFTVASPPGRSMDIGLGLVRTLVDDHEATVLEYDVGDDGLTIAMTVPSPSPLRRLLMLHQIASARMEVLRGLVDDLERRRRAVRETLERHRLLRQSLRRESNALRDVRLTVRDGILHQSGTPASSARG